MVKMQVLVEHLGGVQFEIKARKHTIACDQPMENGGFDEGVPPQTDQELTSFSNSARLRITRVEPLT